MALFWDRLPSPAGYVEWVSCKGPVHLLALYGVDCGFSALAPPLGGVCIFSIRGYRLMLSSVFHFRLPVISFHPVLQALLFRCLPPAGLFALLLGPCGVSSPSTFLVVRITPFVSSPLAYLDGSLLCGLSDGHPYWRASGALPLFFFRPR